MAGFGTVIKNGLVFLILATPFLYLGAFLINYYIQVLFAGAFQEISLFTEVVDGENKPVRYDSGITFLFLGLLSIIGGAGLMFMKGLSDTVEEGMMY